MRNKILLLFLALVIFNKAGAQKNVTLSIAGKLGANNFAFNAVAQNNLSQNFKITRVDYYMSKISIIHDGGTVTPVPGYILVKGNNVTQPLGSYNITQVEAIRFSIGVDSPTNNEDPTFKVGALGYQNPSMHWGWAAGYRFVALEGKAGSNVNTEFELHGLGNANYFEQTIAVPGVVSGDDITINLDADYTQAVYGIDIASGPKKHGENLQDLDMLKNFRDRVFKAGSGATAVNDISYDENIRVYPNPVKGKIYIDASGSANIISAYKLMDVAGRIIASGNVNSNTVALKNCVPGNYILMLYNKEQPVFSQMIAVE